MHKGWVRNPNHIPQHRNDDSFPLLCVWGSWQWKWWIAPLHLGSFQCLGDPVLMLSFVRTGWQVHTLWPFADSHWAFLWTCIAFFLFFLYWSSPSGIVPSPSSLSSPSARFQIALYFWIQRLQGCDPFSELAEWACLWVLVCEGHNCYLSSLGLGHVGVNSLIFCQSDLKPKKKCGTTSGNLCLPIHECF